MIYIIIGVILLMFVISILFIILRNTNSNIRLPLIDHDINQRVEALELCDVNLDECQDIMRYVKDSIHLFQNSNIKDWQSLAMNNINKKHNIYLFIVDDDYNEIVDASIEDFKPYNLYNMKDITDNYIGRDVYDTGKQGGGWITYYWRVKNEKLNDNMLKKKYSFILPFRYNNKTYYIGSGDFLFPGIESINKSCGVYSTILNCEGRMNKCKSVMERVDTISNLFEDHGNERALEILKNNRNEFKDDKYYVYVNNFEGDILFNTKDKETEGRNVYNSECFRSAIDNIDNCGSGWNKCNINGVDMLGYDKTINNCEKCELKDRLIIGSSFKI